MRNLKNYILKFTAFSVVALFMNFAVLAQTQGGSSQDTARQDKTSVSKSQTQTSSQEQNMRSDELMSQDHDQGISYSEEVDNNNLPQEVNRSIKELYPAHNVEEVHQGDDDSFRVKVKNKNDEAYVYYDSEGSFLRARNISEGQSAYPQQQSQSTRKSGMDDMRNRQGQSGSDQNDMGTQRGTSTQGQGTNQGTHGSEWGTGTQSQGTQQGTQGTNRGTSTQGQGTNQGTQGSEWGTGTQSQGTQQGTQGTNRGTSTQGQGTNQGTQGSEWGTGTEQGTQGSGTLNRGSQQGTEAKPQDQNQRTDERFGTQSDLGTQRDRDNRSDASDLQGTAQGTLENWDTQSQDRESSAYPQSQSQRADETGTDMRNQTDAERGRLGSPGTIGSSGISGYDSSSDTITRSGEFGSRDHSTTTTQGQYGAGQEGSATSQSQAQRGEDDGDVDYSEEIDEKELPESASNSLKELYPAHNVDKVYRGDDDSFKVKVKNNKEEVAVYYDSNGEFKKAKNLNDEDR